jgi:catechol 2,3-dioxygenase-like lactoylglutathione lyase family enzyme
MKKALPLLLLVCATFSSAESRPRITGIDHVVFFTTAPEPNHHLFAEVLGLASGQPLESGQIQRYLIGKQWVGYSSATDTTSPNRMDHVAFDTDNCAALHRYLSAHGISSESPTHLKDGSISFRFKDPEGHNIEFVQRPASTTRAKANAGAISRHMIHVGFVVNDRAAEDHFYKDILGFHIYWYGGMTDDRTDWVAMQVPDGTDWLEYMLNGGPHPDQHTMGVMDHISLGVPDMKKAQAELEAHGWKPHGPEHAQMGRDGKWQLNVYDSDLTRVELMEFKPVEKPCCSDFTGPHPTE